MLHLWDEQGREKLRQLRDNPHWVEQQNEPLWNELRDDWKQRELASLASQEIPNGLVRYQILDLLRASQPKAKSPEHISNEVARLCMQRSYEGLDKLNGTII